MCYKIVVKSADSNSFIHDSYEQISGSNIQAVFLSSGLWKSDDIS